MASTSWRPPGRRVPKRRYCLLIACRLWLECGGALADAPIEEVIVRGRAPDRPSLDIAQPETELEGQALRREVSATLGETLARQPGVNNASFGPGVGLPVIRGLSGVRVKIVEDDIGAWDASSLGPDHAGGIEAVLAERIHIIRGPAALSYGNGAIGGVVAVDTQRIPAGAPDRPLSAFAEQRNEIVNTSRQSTSAVKLDGGAGFFAVHGDAFLREQDDTSIPGYAIDDAAIIEQFGVAPNGNTRGHLANTQTRAQGGAIGTAVVGGPWNIGFSYSDLANDYGIPLGGHIDAGHVHGPGGAETETTHAVRIDMQQTRRDFRLGWQGDSRWLESVELRAGQIDYQHRELENGAKGTLFENDVTELRLELIHARIGRLSGSAGVQHIDRDFAAVGAEAFVPPSSQRSTGLWVIEKLEFTRWQVQAGIRAERQRVEQRQPSATLDGVTVTHTPMAHTTYNTMLSVSYALTENFRISATGSRAQRAPDIQELLALGPHLATQTFDIGDSTLKQERFDNVDAGIVWTSAWAYIDFHYFYNRANDFIFQQNTGFFFDTAEKVIRINCVKLEECLPVQRYRQENAYFHGYELEIKSRPITTGPGTLATTFFSDYVRGRLRGGDDIPRMPPLRVGFRFEYGLQSWSGDIEFIRVAAQSHPGLNETSTDSYLDVRAGIEHHIEAAADVTLFMRGRNLLNREIRNATSFLRNYAPEAGRSLEVGFNVAF